MLLRLLQRAVWPHVERPPKGSYRTDIERTEAPDSIQGDYPASHRMDLKVVVKSVAMYAM